MPSVHYYWIVLWTSIEPTLGVVGACLPTLRPFFSGVSPESIIRSIRSQISLSSMRSPKGSPKGSADATNHSGPASDSNERFAHQSEGMEASSTVENYISTTELEDRNQAKTNWRGKGNGIHVSQDVHQRTEDMV